MKKCRILEFCVWGGCCGVCLELRGLMFCWWCGLVLSLGWCFLLIVFGEWGMVFDGKVFGDLLKVLVFGEDFGE